MTKLTENEMLISQVERMIAGIRKRTSEDPTRLAHIHETIAARDFDRTTALQIVGLIDQCS